MQKHGTNANSQSREATQTPLKVERVPQIRKEDNICKGFLNTEFLAPRNVLPECLKGLVTLAQKNGMAVFRDYELDMVGCWSHELYSQSNQSDQILHISDIYHYI